jgi:hypothetical protein
VFYFCQSLSSLRSSRHQLNFALTLFARYNVRQFRSVDVVNKLLLVFENETDKFPGMVVQCMIRIIHFVMKSVSLTRRASLILCLFVHLFFLFFFFFFSSHFLSSLFLIAFAFRVCEVPNRPSHRVFLSLTDQAPRGPNEIAGDISSLMSYLVSSQKYRTFRARQTQLYVSSPSQSQSGSSHSLLRATLSGTALSSAITRRYETLFCHQSSLSSAISCHRSETLRRAAACDSGQCDSCCPRLLLTQGMRLK